MQIPDTQKGLVGHWTMNFEDVDNGIVRDRSALDNHGTISGGITTGKDAPVREAFDFDGSSGTYINVGPDLPIDSAPVSIFCWVNLNSGYSQNEMCPLGNYNGNGIIFRSRPASGDDLEFWFGGNAHSTSSGVLTERDEWVHIGATLDQNGNVVYYKNGSTLETVSTSDTINANGEDFRIGTRDASGTRNDMDGKLSDLRVYDHVLSATDVSSLYEQRSERTANFYTVGELYKVDASGGTTSTNDSGYKIHEFTSDGTFTVNSKGVIDFLLVGGGGGGGGSGGGGGGAGGLVFAKEQITSGSYSVTVGSGGSGGVEQTSASGEGGDSSFLSYTATGGGGGGTRSIDGGHDGGSGGGGNKQGFNTPGTGVSGQGYDGGFGNNYGSNGVAGGGGGAGEQGQDEERGFAGDGGIGRYFGDAFSEDFGDNGFFAGGGGGSAERFVGSGGDGADNGEVISVGDGGKGGGGRAGGRQGDSSGNGFDAIDGTGGGGGGANQRGGSNGTRIGGDGGNGIVLIRYKN